MKETKRNNKYKNRKHKRTKKNRNKGGGLNRYGIRDMASRYHGIQRKKKLKDKQKGGETKDDKKEEENDNNIENNNAIQSDSTENKDDMTNNEPVKKTMSNAQKFKGLKRKLKESKEEVDKINEDLQILMDSYVKDKVSLEDQIKARLANSRKATQLLADKEEQKRKMEIMKQLNTKIHPLKGLSLQQQMDRKTIAKDMANTPIDYSALQGAKVKPTDLIKKNTPDFFNKTDEELMEPDADILPIGTRISKYWLKSALILFRTSVDSFFKVMQKIGTPLKGKALDKINMLSSKLKSVINNKKKLKNKGDEKGTNGLIEDQLKELLNQIQEEKINKNEEIDEKIRILINGLQNDSTTENEPNDSSQGDLDGNIYELIKRNYIVDGEIIDGRLTTQFNEKLNEELNFIKSIKNIKHDVSGNPMNIEKAITKLNKEKEKEVDASLYLDFGSDEEDGEEGEEVIKSTVKSTTVPGKNNRRRNRRKKRTDDVDNKTVQKENLDSKNETVVSVGGNQGKMIKKDRLLKLLKEYNKKNPNLLKIKLMEGKYRNKIYKFMTNKDIKADSKEKKFQNNLYGKLDKVFKLPTKYTKKINFGKYLKPKESTKDASGNEYYKWKEEDVNAIIKEIKKWKEEGIYKKYFKEFIEKVNDIEKVNEVSGDKNNNTTQAKKSSGENPEEIKNMENCKQILIKEIKDKNENIKKKNNEKYFKHKIKIEKKNLDEYKITAIRLTEATIEKAKKKINDSTSNNPEGLPLDNKIALYDGIIEKEPKKKVFNFKLYKPYKYEKMKDFLNMLDDEKIEDSGCLHKQQENDIGEEHKIKNKKFNLFSSTSETLKTKSKIINNAETKFVIVPCVLESIMDANEVKIKSKDIKELIKERLNKKISDKEIKEKFKCKYKTIADFYKLWVKKDKDALNDDNIDTNINAMRYMLDHINPKKLRMLRIICINDPKNELEKAMKNINTILTKEEKRINNEKAKEKKEAIKKAKKDKKKAKIGGRKKKSRRKKKRRKNERNRKKTRRKY